MSAIIIVYKKEKNHAVIPIAEINWTGDPPVDLSRFAKEHGGDIADYILEHDWEDYSN